ncbi:MAG: hypothetical protein KAS84_01715 [Anaerolineales bacterium]|nr:hypothetical protein [Anaerolineales bacterium]
MSSLLQYLAVVVLFLCPVGILLVDNWRWMIGLLGLQYIGVLSLVSVSWPLEIAVVKLVAGWMAAAILILTYVNLPTAAAEPQISINLPRRFFKGFTAFLIGLSVYSLQAVALRWFLGATTQQALGGLLLLGLGLLQLGLSREVIRIVIGLLTVISGFEVLYATLEASVLMTGLLAILNIGIAFVGAYLLLASYLEDTS